MISSFRQGVCVVGVKRSLLLLLVDGLVFVGEEGGHAGVAAAGAIVGGVFGGGAFLLLLLLLEFLGQDVQLLDAVVVGVVPPLVLPVVVSGRLLAEAEVVLPALDLHAVCVAVLVLAEPLSLLPPHLRHQLLGVLALEGNVGDAGALQQSFSVFGRHQQSIIIGWYRELIVQCL